MSTEDMSYLEAKGCFSLPSEEVCEQLIQCYFHYVHPLLPLVDIEAFFQDYLGTSGRTPKLLLLWSMFSVAISVSCRERWLKTETDEAKFAPESVVRASGYESTKEIKVAMYSRAKVS